MRIKLYNILIKVKKTFFKKNQKQYLYIDNVFGNFL